MKASAPSGCLLRLVGAAELDRQLDRADLEGGAAVEVRARSTSMRAPRLIEIVISPKIQVSIVTPAAMRA